MAATETFANEATAIVTSGGTTAPVSGTVETWTVASSAGWPSISTGTTQGHVSDPLNPSELILVTNISGTTWTVTRGAESTTPVAHTAGFTVNQVVTAGWLNGVVSGGLSNPMTTLGDMISGGAAGAAARLAGDTSNTRKFLRTLSSGGVATAPVWDTIQAADVPTLNQNTSGTAAGLSSTLAIGSGGTGQTTQQAALDALAGAVTAALFLRGNGTHVVMGAIQAGDMPTGTTGAQGALQLDGTAGDIQPAGQSAVAGNKGQPADAKHIHPPGSSFLCTPSSYAPGTQTLVTTTSTTMAAMSSANINTGSFTAPASGSVLVTATFVGGINANAGFAFGLCAHGTTTPMVCNNVVFDQSSASLNPGPYSLEFLVTGLTPGTSYNFDLMGCVTSGDTLTILAMGSTSTSPTFTSGGRGAPVIMTVQAV